MTEPTDVLIADPEVPGMTEPVAELEPLELRVADRCDNARCPSQAWVITEHAGSHLIWCAHCFNKLEPAIVASGGTVALDKRDQINARPSISAY